MADVISIENAKVREIQLPEVFKRPVNPVVIKKAFLSEQSEGFQLKYTDPLAGSRKSAELTKRRFGGKHGKRAYKTVYGRGLTRVPKKTMMHRGSTFFYVGAVAPNTVGGREAHPPEADKVLVKKINKKEKKLAVEMATAASANKDLVSRFHSIKDLQSLPLVVEDKINEVSKTKDAIKILSKIGLGDEVSRVAERTIRAGKGKMRGRKYKRKLGLVIVTTDDSKISKAMGNINVSVKKPSQLSISDVSHAGMPGRLIIWTEGAIASLK